MQESVEDIPGVDEDLVLDILYSKESERFLKIKELIITSTMYKQDLKK